MSICLSVCLSVVGTDENWNFCAVRSPIELKPGGDLGLVFQISLHALVSRLVCFRKRQNHENRGFRKLEISPPFKVRLI